MDTKNNYQLSEEYSNGKYKFLNFSGDKNNFKRISCETESICLIPFDTSDSKIKNIYLAKYWDYLINQDNHKSITISLKLDEFNSYHDSLVSGIESELGINDVNRNDIYYLGQITHNVPFYKKYKCFAINVTDYSEDANGFTPKAYDLNTHMHSIEKVKFTRILNGEISDSLVLSGSLLLLSYLND